MIQLSDYEVQADIGELNERSLRQERVFEDENGNRFRRVNLIRRNRKDPEQKEDLVRWQFYDSRSSEWKTIVDDDSIRELSEKFADQISQGLIKADV